MKAAVSIIVLGGLGALGLAGPAMGRVVKPARRAAPSHVVSLTTIVITAQKRPEKWQNVPETVQVVGNKQLRDQRVFNIAALSQTTPSLEMIQSFGGPGGGGQIRGLGTQSFTNSAEGAVGIVVDGVAQGNVNISDLFDIQHIEVLEGPQGTLFGLTSSAGIINIVTNPPDPRKFQTIWHFDYAHKGTAGSEFGQQVVQGAVNLPLSRHSALRIAGSLDDNQGVQHNSLTNTDDKAGNYALRVSYLAKPASRWSLYVIGDVQRTVQHGAQGGAIASFNYVYADPTLTSELAACGITPGFGNQDRCANHPEVASDTNYGLSTEIDYDFGAGTLSSITAYRRDESGPNSQDIQAVPQEIPQLWDVGVLGSAHQFTQELRVVSHPGAKLAYTAGLYYLNYLTLGYSTSYGFSHVLFPFPPFEVGSTFPLTETSIKSSAAYGQATYHLTQHWGLIGGARYTYETISDYDSPLGLRPGAANNAGSSSLGLVTHDISGKAGVQYRFNRNWTSYATVTRGYKGPQAQAATPATPAVLIPAEIPLAYEVGIKGITWQSRLAMSFTLFDTKDHNYQGQSCALAPFGALECVPNTVDVTSKGAEIDLNARPLRGWTVAGGYMYDKAVYPRGYQGENPNALVGPENSLPMGGLQLVGAPRNKLTFSTQYTLPLGALDVFAGTDVVYKSSIREGPSPDPRFVYPAHWVLGARLGIGSLDGRWSVTLYGRDLNNAHEPLTLFGGPAFVPPGVDPALVGFVQAEFSMGAHGAHPF